MPKISTEVQIYDDVDVDISVEGFLDNCDSLEISQLIKLLEEDGEIVHTSYYKDNILDDEWNEYVKKLYGLRLRLLKEDEQTIKDIINKY